MKLQDHVNENDWRQGKGGSSVTLVEYGDFACPYAAKAYFEIKRVQRHFGNQLSFVFRHYPQTNIHTHSLRAACAAEASGLHGLFWPMHDLLFENRKHLLAHHLLEYAKQVGLETDQFIQDINSQTVAEKVINDVLGAQLSGVRGTPTFFINDILYSGKYDFESLSKAINDTIP